MGRLISRRHLLHWGAALLGTTALGACFPSFRLRPEVEDKGKSILAKRENPVHLTFWGFAFSRNEWYRALAKRYADQHSQITIKVIEVDGYKILDRLLMALAAGTGAPDLVDIEASQFGYLVRKERIGLLPLNGWVAEYESYLYRPSALSPWSWQGKYYGIGNELNACLLFYRWDLLEEAGIEYPINTWEEFIQKGKNYVAKTRKKWVSLSPTGWDYWWMIAQAFNGFFDEEGNPSFDNEGGVKTMKMLADWKWVHDIVVMRAEGQAWYGQMSAGEFAVHLGAPWMQGFMKDNAADLEGKWEMQLLPVWEDGSGAKSAAHGGTGTCITKQTKHAEVCWDFIRFCNLTSDGVLLGFEMQNLFPTWKPAWDDPRMQFEDPYFHNQKPAKFITQAAPHMPPVHNSPWWPEVTDAFSRLVITPVLSEERRMPVEEAMAQCREEVERILCPCT